MNTEVFNSIDTLINMANSSLNIDEVNTELININRNIKNKRNEIEDLKSLMVDSRYFNASNELVDKNIEISLKNKINRLNRKVKDIKNTLEEVKTREKRVYKDITTLKEKLEANIKYVDTISEKVKSSKDNEYYKNLLKKEQDNVQELNEELESKNSLYEEILKELELNNQALKELTEKLEQEKLRLNDIMDNLDNPNAYIDEDLKKQDEEQLDKLMNDLDKLEKRKIELLTDANMIGADAKEFLINSDITSAVNKIKELVTIVKAKPYMDISSGSVLDEELEKKEALRDELASLIDNKNYEEANSGEISKRITYIKEEIENNQKVIAEYENKIKETDEFVNSNLGVRITDLEKELLALEKKITEYHTLIKDKDKPTRVKANLESVVSKKEKERDILNEILTNYKDDLIGKIEITKEDSKIIQNKKEANEKLEQELTKLNKLTLMDFNTKDLREEEEDKEKLKALNEEIKDIKNRQKFTKTPDEIFDEIDMILSTMKHEDTNIQEKLETEVLREEKKEEPERLKVVEIIPVETVKTEAGGK